ncbi:MAG TPA: FtsX-like permease family protein [Chthoniobacterales bacterium]|nr:FtsX-like permease family protein [Chthoniobacterales bacterium]
MRLSGEEVPPNPLNRNLKIRPLIAQYSRLFRWQLLRYLVQHPLLAALNIATVALGVALYLAIQVANQSANHAFAASVDLVAGKAQLEVRAPAGNLPNNLFPKIARQPGIAAATPIVRGFVTLPRFAGEYLDLLGIDLFTNQPFRTFQLTDFRTEQFDLQQWLRGPRTIALSEDFARQHRLHAADQITIQHNGKTIRLTIGFLMRKSPGDLAPDPHFAAMDIGWAQELLGRSGTLDSISLRLTKSADAQKVAAKLRKIVPADAIVAAPAQRGAEVDKMLAGFQLNLTAMSLVSLLVGMFLIYNTIEASVVRRRKEIGILRSLGASRSEVRWLFLSEAAVLGAIGIALGLAGGFFMARLLVGAVAGTISSLYVLVSVQQILIAPWVWLSAILLGFASVLGAAWLPARAAAATNPVEALHHGQRIERSVHLSPRWVLGGLLSLGAAVILSLLALQTGPPWLGFGAAFFVLAGFSLVAPEAIARFSRALRRSKLRRLEPRLAAENLGRALLRNSITIASLAAAVAMTVGVAVMVFSFRQTVGSWIDQTLVADLFIGPAANEIAGPSSFMPPEAIRYLEKNPSVTAVDTFRSVQLPFRDTTVEVGVISGSNRRNLRFLHADADQILPRFYRERSVLISESFARRFHLAAGDELHLPTPEGPVAFPILGVFYDYTNDRGLVFLSANNFENLWHDSRVNSVAVYLQNGASPAAVAAAFRKRFSTRGEFSVYSNRALRTRIFEIFDQTFAVTYVLRTIAVIVAVIGIFLGLTTLVAERSRELGVLRAIGASARQVQRLLLWESGMIGLLASVLGIASGLCLAVVLTGVINRAFFGWTIQLAFPWLSLAWTPLWIIAAAIVAGWIPAWRAGRLNVAEAIRSE